MSGPLVVDASVALKWMVSEPGSDEANDLLTDLSTGAVTLFAPEHMIGEVGDGLRKRVAQGILRAEDATGAIDAFTMLGLEFVGGTERWFRSVSAALGWQMTTYDALYVLLARELDTELVTADQRLADAAVDRQLPVRRLGW
ncbi:MAG: type II toxin-antitoxin system VapC family toxin [Nocardioidaceae bacterium]